MFLKRLLVGITLLSLSLINTSTLAADSKKQFNIHWTIYTGWMPWVYAQAKGILAKWAKKHDIAIKITQLNDFAVSINEYIASQFAACGIAARTCSE